MKINLSVLTLLLWAGIASAEPVRLSQPIVQDATTETFGKVLDTSLPKVMLAELLTDSKAHLGKPFQLETRMAKVCQRKGCFFIAQQEQHVVRVSFRDYSFFVPTDSSGKTVTLAGELVEKTISPEQAAHFNSDIKSETLKSGVVYEIVADSVKVPLG